MENTVFSVSQLNAYIKDKFESDLLLNGVCVCGEISNYKVYPSGHHYFTLKDKQASIRCVMFKGNAFSLRFHPENGMSVIAVGRVSVFARDGAYQLYCTHMMPDGAGDLAVAFRQLKEKLEAEGLFDSLHKKPIPKYPHTIAIITSPAGAAVHDMLRILRKRYPLSKVRLLPVRVQGSEAPAEIVDAIQYANQWHIADVIITGRGGGSVEDLWAFNDEKVARAIYASDIPVISAVGHEPDVLISDYVADQRAATPSNAAELVAPDQAKLKEMLSMYQNMMIASIKNKLRINRSQLYTISHTAVFQQPQRMIHEKRLVLDLFIKKLYAAETTAISEKRQKLIRLTAGLEAMSPLRVLSRGYTIAVNNSNHVVSSVRNILPAEQLRLKFHDGTVQTIVQSIKEENTNGEI